MGIPYYYRTLIEKYPDILEKKIENVDSLFLDFNGIVHFAAQKVMEERTYNKIHQISYENAIINKCHERIDQLLSLTNPTNTLGIFVDGPAVKAKMNQQFQRRIKGPFENLKKDEFRKESKMPSVDEVWDKNAITPGTKFMDNLNIYLHNLSTNTKYNNLNLIVSGSDVPGEGEHKMFNYIKRNMTHLNVDIENPENTEKIVIVGLDADLIMLSLVTHFDNIYLMRESTEFRIPGAENDFSFLDCAMLKYNLIGEIKQMIKDDAKQELLYTLATHEAIIDDYIFMTMMLGNDFIPHTPSLSIREDGIDRLMRLYADVFQVTKTHLVTISDRKDPDKIKVSVNYESIKLLIRELALVEDEKVNAVYNDRIGLEKRGIRNRVINSQSQSINQYNLLWHQHFYKPALSPNIGKELDLELDGNDGWRENYFENVLRIERTKENITEVCHNYLVGLKWVMDYYYTETHSWNYYYKYIMGPLFWDCYKYLNKLGYYPIEDENNKKMTPYKPFEQLLMVLPRNSSHLLPSKIAKLMTNKTSPIIEYYPESVDYDDFNFYFHVAFWEAEPLFEKIDPKLVEKTLKDIKLNENELHRNSFGELKYYLKNRINKPKIKKVLPPNLSTNKIKVLKKKPPK